MTQQATELIATQLGSAISTQRTWGSIIYNVKDPQFAGGAKGDGVTDDSSAFQSVANKLVLTGGTIYIPPGRYKIGTRIDIDLTGNKPRNLGKGISIRGDDMNTTVLVNETVGDYVLRVFQTDFVGESTVSYFLMENLHITKGVANNTNGIKMSGFANSSIQNVVISLLNTGLYLEDIVSCKLDNIRFDQNLYGINAVGQVNLTTPNAIDIYSCTFYGNGVFGAYFNEGCNINFFGGSVETSGGRSDLTGQRWGVKLDGLGRYGAGGASFYGTYFEGNQSIADVWINHKDYPATYTFIGCTFNRFADPKNSTNHIRLDTNSNLNITVSPKVIVQGCGFRAFAGYVPDAARRVIQFYGTTPSVLEQSGNYYNNQVDLPGPATNRLFAHGRFVSLSTTPSLYRGFNVSAITRNAIGDYTITFQFPSVITEKITTIGMDQIGFTQVTVETTTTIRIKCWAANGTTAIDPAQLSFQSYE